MITKKNIEAEFDSKFKGWIIQDDQESYRSFEIVKDFCFSIPLSLLESLEKDVAEKRILGDFKPYTDERYRQESYNDAVNSVLSLIKQYKEQLK